MELAAQERNKNKARELYRNALDKLYELNRYLYGDDLDSRLRLFKELREDDINKAIDCLSSGGDYDKQAALVAEEYLRNYLSICASKNNESGDSKKAGNITLGLPLTFKGILEISKKTGVGTIVYLKLYDGHLLIWTLEFEELCQLKLKKQRVSPKINEWMEKVRQSAESSRRNSAKKDDGDRKALEELSKMVLDNDLTKRLRQGTGSGAKDNPTKPCVLFLPWSELWFLPLDKLKLDDKPLSDHVQVMKAKSLISAFIKPNELKKHQSNQGSSRKSDAGGPSGATS